jgi:diketogulonate reductase-like aldo/keto reductase
MEERISTNDINFKNKMVDEATRYSDAEQSFKELQNKMSAKDLDLIRVLT